MIKNTRFVSQLMLELKEWADTGLITPDQKIRIEEHYRDPSAAVSKKPSPAVETQPVKTPVRENINLSRVIIGLATLCLAVGIIIFYASNWRRMPPSLKLVQIFILILATYGTSYWFLQAERNFSRVGRSLLLLGIISYGTGIMLIAQVYHISSHPTNGLLAWAAGAFAISILMRERYGIYLSMLLFFIYDIWEYSIFGNPGYLFILPLVIIAWISYKENDRTGITASALLFSFWFLQISYYWIDLYSADPFKGYLITTGFVFVGAAMQKAGRNLKEHTLLKSSGSILFVTGWIAYALPLLLTDSISPSVSYLIPVWGSAVLAASFALRHRNGYYIAAFLFFTWSCVAQSPAYGYIVPVLILAAVFYLEKDETGIALSAVSLIYYYYIPTVELIGFDRSGYVFSYLVVMLQFPFAALVITAGRYLSDHPVLKSAGRVFTVAGWFSFIIPFVAMSWPLDMESFPLLIKFGTVWIQAMQYIILSASSLVMLSLLYRRKEDLRMILPVVLFPVMVIFLPFNHTSARMITLHLAAAGFILIFLYYSHIIYRDKTFERFFAFLFSIGLIIIKGIGFISYSVTDEGYRLAYLTGFILFANVCFLINRLVREMLSAESTEYNSNAVDAVCAAGVWISIYLASFQVESQKSIFSADTLVVKMSLLLITLSVLLYFRLFSIIKIGRIILFLSLVIFLSSGITVFIAGPSVPWELYSITFNLLLLTTSAVYMYYSTAVQSKKILNFATAAIIIQVFTRYFDMFWDMFSGSILFIVTGILGLAGGYLLEKKRKNLTEMIETTADRKNINGGTAR